MVDFDTIDLSEPGKPQYLAVLAETNQVSAVLVTDSSKLAQTVLKLPFKLASVTISRPKGSSKFVVVIACFDQSLLLAYPLVLTDQSTLKFGAEQCRIPNAHDVPVGRARLSRT